MGRKRYPKYKPSGVEWLGDVPEHWEKTRFKYKLWLSRGFDLPLESLIEGNYPVFGSNGVIGFHEEFTTHGPCVIVGRSGSVGEVNYVRENFWAHNTALYVQKFLEVLPRFAYYLLSMMDLKSLSAGSAVGTLNRNYIHDVFIALPLIIEQKAIADYLDRETAELDRLIEKKKKLIELLKEKRQALISQVVTRGLDPQVKLKPSGVEWLGDIPTHWIVKRVGFGYEIRLGRMLQPEPLGPQDRLIPYLKAVNVQWEKVDVTELPEMWVTPNEFATYQVINGDLLVCEGGEVGRAGLLNNLNGIAIIQNALHRVRSQNNSVEFLLYVLELAANQKWFEILCNKATIAHFTREKFVALKIPFPPLVEQVAIATYLDQETAKIDHLVGKIEQAIETLKEYRTALISAVVTGQIDVR